VHFRRRGDLNRLLRLLLLLRLLMIASRAAPASTAMPASVTPILESTATAAIRTTVGVTVGASVAAFVTVETLILLLLLLLWSVVAGSTRLLGCSSGRRERPVHVLRRLEFIRAACLGGLR